VGANEARAVCRSVIDPDVKTRIAWGIGVRGVPVRGRARTSDRCGGRRRHGFRVSEV